MTEDQTFETRVRDTLQDVTAAFPADPGLADRLIANAHAGSRKVVPLRAHRRYTLPLLAAAVCVLLVGGIVLGTRLFSSQQPSRPPLPVQPPATSSPVTTSVSAPTAGPSSPGTAGTAGTGGTAGTAPGADSGRVTQLAAATGAPEKFHAASVDFLDARTGWALGDAVCGTGGTSNCPALISTTDGGASWTPLELPTDLSSSTVGTGCSSTVAADAEPCVNRVEFADDQVGYLWGGSRVYLTKDGGKTWSAAVATTGISTVHVFRGTVFRVRVEDPGDGSGSAVPGPSVLESAPLGSTDFTATRLPSVDGPQWTSLIPAGDGQLFVGSEDLDTLQQKILRTTDGVHWQPWIDTFPCGAQVSAFATVGALDGSLIFQCQDTVRVAAAGSKSLGPQRKLPAGSTAIAGALSGTDFAVLTDGAPDADGLASTGSAITRTTDGGVHWAANLPLDGPIGQAATVDETALGQVAGGYYDLAPLGGALRVSVDSGDTWQIRPFGR